MGIGTIRDARHCVLVATGKHKADALARAVEGPVTAMVPASALQHHPRTTVIVDEEAGANLTLQDYYRHVFAHKPDWQKS
jgi:glucosamine-6-phosphate deaminase